MNWKDLKALLTEDRAVSPVIGVILMVAVTVILAAIVAMFVLGLGGASEANPQASFSFEYDGTNLDITHDGGDGLEVNQVSVLVAGTEAGASWSDANGNSKIDAGDSYTTTASSGDVVKVVWEGDNGDTATLATYEVP